MKMSEMWSVFIFLVLIIFKAEASLPRRDRIEFTFKTDSKNFLTCDHGDDKKQQNKYTLLEGEKLPIFITHEKYIIENVKCHAYNNESESFASAIIVLHTLHERWLNFLVPVKKNMATLWNCTIWICPETIEWKRCKEADLVAVSCFMTIHVRQKVAPQTMLVNNMVVPAVREDQTENDVDFTAEYHYVNEDIVNVACVNLLKEDNASLTMEYEKAGTTSDKSTVKDISSSTMIGIVTKLHAEHNNSYMICTNTETIDYTKVMIRFVMLTTPNIVSVSINGIILRPRLSDGSNRRYEIKYKLVSHQPMHVKCEVERTGLKLLMLDGDFSETKRTKKELIPMKKTELSFYLNPGVNRSLDCAAEYVTGAQAELVNIEFTTANLPIDIYSPVHMKLPPSGTVMELYSYKDYKLSVILYELKQNETLHLSCGPLLFPPGPEPVLYLELNNTEICNINGCNVSTTLQHVSREHVYPPIVCYLKEEAGFSLFTSTTMDPVYKEIRVIFRERAPAVTEPSSTTLSTTLTADIFTNNTATEPPSSNTNTLAYGLIAAGIAIVIIIIVVVEIKKQYCVRWCLPIPAPRLDPASPFYINLLSVARPINEREVAELPENHYEEIPHGDLQHNTNKYENQYNECHDDDHPLNGEGHHETPVSVENLGLVEPEYMEIDYSRCKPKVIEAPPGNSYVYDEPYTQ